MAKTNMEVSFIDENDVKDTPDTFGGEKKISEAEKEHMILDIIHKLFVIASFHNHRKALNEVEAKKEKASKPRVVKGVLS